MSETEESAVLICNAVKDAKLDEQIPGTGMSSCEECGTDIYVSPSGQDLIESRENVKPMCQHCGLKEIRKQKATGEKIKYGLAPGAIEELIHAVWLKQDGKYGR